MPADPRPPASPGAGGGTGAGPVGSVAVAVPEPGPVPPSPLPEVIVRPEAQGAVCPYLRADDGSWRAAVATRDHRCWAVEPASILPSATQQELCLTPAHGGCERFLHTRSERAVALARDQIEIGRLESARFGPFARPVMVAVDPRPPANDHGMRSASGRRRVPGLLIGAGVILVGIVALAAILGGGHLPGFAGILASPTPRHSGGLAGQATVAPTLVAPAASEGASFLPARTPAITPAATGTPSLHPATTPRATPSAAAPTPTGVPTPVPTRVPATPHPGASPQPEPTATVRPTPMPEIARRYTVKQGDTVKSIANKFGLKPRDLRAVNHIGKEVVVGQRLRIPARSVSPP